MSISIDHGKPSDFSAEPLASPSAINSSISSPMLSRNGTIVETIVESPEIKNNPRSQKSGIPFNCNGNNSTCGTTGYGEVEEKTCQSEFKRLSKRFKPQLVLENHGSVARDHLASERTFLAYVRTSLAIASTGVVLVQLLTISVDASTHGSSTSLTIEPMSRQLHVYAKPLGSAFVVFSVVVLIIGLARYFSIQNALTLNQFPVARLVIILSSLILGALIVFTFAILVAG